jgi:chemotaxis response regulator CheB
MSSSGDGTTKYRCAIGRDARRRVLLVDDDGGLRRLVVATLEAHPGFLVVGEAASGREAIDHAVTLKPDVVILDLGLPDLAANDVLSSLRARCPRAQVIVFTGEERDSLSELGEASAAAFVTKGDFDVLVDVLEAVSRDALVAAEILLDPDPQAARDARHFVEQQCMRWGCTGMEENVCLIVSELVTNAVVHAHSPARLRLNRAEAVFRIEVHDTSVTSPAPQNPTTNDAGGRGLLIVAALSQAWGVEPSPSGKVVWAELAMV